MKAAILGATGYTGMILLRLLADHPDITEIIPVSSSSAGKHIKEIDPGVYTALAAKTAATGGCTTTVAEAVKAAPDVVFAALPHLESAKICEPFFGKAVIIDLSADFRIKNHDTFFKAYGVAPERPDLLEKAVYGLSEIYTNEIKKADLVANPGCYPTSVLLPTLPIVKEFGLKGRVIINSLSGVSGAGKKAAVNNLFVERTENCGAYAPGTSHRHQPEIKQELDRNADDALPVLFTPHLVPLKRGMESTIIVEPAKQLNDADIAAVYEKYYGNSPFVEADGGRLPQSRDVWGSNSCRISWKVEDGVLMLFSVIDNLVKGASGQAVQNMNIRFGLNETAGLKVYGEL